MQKDLERLKKLLNKKSYIPEVKVPEYAIHNYNEIRGFFGKYRFLSNFYACPNGIWYEGLKYPTVEHAYQAAKVDVEDREKFLNCTVKDVKRLGGSVTIGVEEWNVKKYYVMSQLVLQKFATHDNLRESLLATGKAFLEEANHWRDVYWGVCDGVGQNKLGVILMGVREILSS